MSLDLEPTEIEAAYIEACRLDVASLKPGNVHVFADGHRMTVSDFSESARVSARYVADPTLTVGQRVRTGVEATFEAVGCNTNLGILLLCAPLALAVGCSPGRPSAVRRGVAAKETSQASAPRVPRSLSRGGEGSESALGAIPSLDALSALRTSVKEVLERLTHEDARDVYRAIARANPAGLGNAAGADVRHDPPAGLTLLDAMSLAAGRDLVARQYATGFDTIFDLCGAAFLPVTAEGLPMETALSYIFLQLLAAQPDTHIARKHGTQAAEAVCEEANAVISDLRFCSPWDWGRPEVEARLIAFDAGLKSRGLNPGSLADLMAAIAFVGLLAITAGPDFAC